MTLNNYDKLVGLISCQYTKKVNNPLMKVLIALLTFF